MDAIKTGKMIRESRMKKKMTQQALADAIGVSATAVSKWENGHSLPDITMLEPLSSALDISISELVLGERSREEMENNQVETKEVPQEAASKEVSQEAALKEVIGESVKQRKRAVLKWVAITLGVAILGFAAWMLLFIIGFPAKQENIRIKTEIQENDGNPNPEWVIHFYTVDGKPLYADIEFTSFEAEDGKSAVEGAIIHLNVAPLGHANPGQYSWGFSVGGDLMPTEDYDFIVVVKYGDGEVRYSVREEGLFEVLE